MAYAIVTDLEERWRPLTPDESTRADILLDDAALVIDVECPSVAERIADGDETAVRAALRVSCEMVKRAMLSPLDTAPMQQLQQQGGPFSMSGTFVNPTGDLYLTKGDRRLLGCRRQRAGSVNLLARPEESDGDA